MKKTILGLILLAAGTSSAGEFTITDTYNICRYGQLKCLEKVLRYHNVVKNLTCTRQQGCSSDSKIQFELIPGKNYTICNPEKNLYKIASTCAGTFGGAREINEVLEGLNIGLKGVSYTYGFSWVTWKGEFRLNSNSDKGPQALEMAIAIPNYCD